MTKTNVLHEVLESYLGHAPQDPPTLDDLEGALASAERALHESEAIVSKNCGEVLRLQEQKAWGELEPDADIAALNDRATAAKQRAEDVKRHLPRLRQLVAEAKAKRTRAQIEQERATLKAQAKRLLKDAQAVDDAVDAAFKALCNVSKEMVSGRSVSQELSYTPYWQADYLKTLVIDRLKAICLNVVPAPSVAAIAKDAVAVMQREFDETHPPEVTEQAAA